MRFFTLISTCSFLVSAIAGHLPTPVQRSPNPDGLTLLTKRQFPIGPVDLTLCATVNADVDIGARLPLNLLSLPVLTQLGLVIGQTTNVRLTENLCLCVVAGALTPDTLARLRVDLADQTGVVAELLKVASVDVVLNPIVQALLVILGQRQNAPGSCTYPTGAQPICGSCDFTCAEGTFRCGDRCLANGTPCPSGISYRRRRSTASPDLLCPKGLMACSTSFKVQGVFGRIECHDTKSNIETCGGCEFPLPGRPKGIDCSAIEGSEEVACVKGRCVVEACQSGFALVDGRRCEPLRA